MKLSVAYPIFIFAFSTGLIAEDFLRADQFAIEATIEGVDFEKLLGNEPGKYSSGSTELPRTVVRPGNEASICLTISGTESQPVFNKPNERGISLLLTCTETAQGDIQFSGDLKIAASPIAESLKSKGAIKLASVSESAQIFSGSCRPSEPIEFSFYTTEGKRATLRFTIYPLDIPGKTIR